MLTPLNDYILVLPEEERDLTQVKGIYVPTSSATQDHKIGVVVDIGTGRMTEYGVRITPDSSLRGKTVIFSKYAGQDIEYENRKYLFLKETDLLGVIG